MFQVNWPFGSGEEAKKKKYFQDGGHGSHLGFLNGTSLAIFDLQVTPLLPTMFQLTFRHGGHVGFPIGTILAIFNLQVTPTLRTTFRVDLINGSGIVENAKS